MTKVREAPPHQQTNPRACVQRARLPRGQAAPRPPAEDVLTAAGQLPEGAAGLGEEAGDREAQAVRG